MLRAVVSALPPSFGLPRFGYAALSTAYHTAGVPPLVCSSQLPEEATSPPQRQLPGNNGCDAPQLCAPPQKRVRSWTVHGTCELRGLLAEQATAKQHLHRRPCTLAPTTCAWAMMQVHAPQCLPLVLQMLPHQLVPLSKSWGKEGATHTASRGIVG